MNARNTTIHAALVVRLYAGERCIDQTLQPLDLTLEAAKYPLLGGKLVAEVKQFTAGDTRELEVAWRVQADDLPACGLGVAVLPEDWSTSGYPWMPAAAYQGNRFVMRKQGYSPRYPEADAGPDAPIIITDIPRLRLEEGPSRMQLLLGDLSAPAMGYVNPQTGSGVYVNTNRIDPCDMFEISENEARDAGMLLIMRGGVREGKYRFPKLATDVASGDCGLQPKAGMVVEQRLSLRDLAQAGIQSLFDAHFDWMMAVENLPRDRIAKGALSLKEAFAVVEDKYNRENWNEANVWYATTCDPESAYPYQTGWCGGGIADSALLCGRDPLSRNRAERALNQLCTRGQLPSGFFYGKCTCEGVWCHDFSADASRPYTHRWNLVRREGDLLLYLLKAAHRDAPDVAPESRAKWLAAARKLAEALCTLWQRHGQLGQFIDPETGDIAVGGSASGGVVPAGLALASKQFDEPQFLETAEAVAAYFEEQFTAMGISCGGPGDACQAPDSESCAGLLESYVTLAEITGSARWRSAAVCQAAQLASWIMPYDFPFPAGSEFGRHGIPTTGSVFANVQNKHSAPGICTHSGNCLLRLAALTGDSRYATLYDWIARQITTTVSLADRPIHDPTGKPLPAGWINERVNTSDWDNNIGGVFYGSTWSEVALMLMAVEGGPSAR